MTPLPSLDLYNEAVQNPKIAFTDQILQTARVRTNGFGLPLALGGGFAITYSIQAGGRKYAIRVFHKQTNGLETRYRSISRELALSPSPYFVNFEYQASGIRVEGLPYPMVKMEWATGDTLGSFLDAKHGDRPVMESLRRACRDLANHLRDRGIAHGDVQSGNVMVDGGRLRLIDYDGMFVPGMKTGNGSEIGHRHFQHPSRGPDDFGPSMDRFSFIALDVTLAALIEQPRLYLKYATTGDNVLFTGNDFKDPSSSPLFAELREIQSLRKSVDDLALVCQGSIQSVPSLDDFIAGRNIPILTVDTSRRQVSRKHAYVGSLPVIDANDYELASRHVGDRVELIGQVFQVKNGRTKYGQREYLFINFGDWKGRIVKVAIWEDGLSKLRQRPDQSWRGRWISVTGLMDPPYEGGKYTHLSITVQEQQQISFIDQNQAKYRLMANGTAASPSTPESRRNQNLLKTIKGESPINEHPPTGGPTPTKSGGGAISKSSTAGKMPGLGVGQATPKTGNQTILAGIKATAPVVAKVSSSPAQVGSSTTPDAPYRRDFRGVGCLMVIIAVAILYILANRH